MNKNRMAQFRVAYDLAKRSADQDTMDLAYKYGVIELYIELRERLTARGARRALRLKQDAQRPPFPGAGDGGRW